MEVLKGMTIGQLMSNAAGIIAIASIFIQIAPIKFSPITAILKWLGDKLNAGTNANIEALKTDLDAVKDKVDCLEVKMAEVKGDLNKRMDEAEEKRNMQEACNARVRILSFGGEVIRGVGHTEEEFNNVLHDMDSYDAYCREHPNFPNNRTVAISKRIKDVYAECLTTNGFLT